jgi:hypothetical protein
LGRSATWLLLPLLGVSGAAWGAQLQLPEGALVELLLELDRGSEDHARLKEKGRRYAKALPRSQLRDPLILLLVPSAARAERAAAALATSAAPIVTAAWTPSTSDHHSSSSAKPPLPAASPPSPETPEGAQWQNWSSPASVDTGSLGRSSGVVDCLVVGR